MIDDSIGFRQLPWQPVLDKRFGQHVGGVTRNFGGADWRLGRQRGLDLSVLPRSYEGPRQRHMLVAIGAGPTPSGNGWRASRAPASRLAGLT
jgi:hypothetical protein